MSVERQVRVASPSQYSVTQPLSDSDGGGDSWSIEFDAVIVLRSAVDSPVCSSTRCEKVSSKSLSQFVGLVSVLAGVVSERLEVVPAQSEARVKSFGDSSQLTFGDSSQLSCGDSSLSTFEVGCDAREREWQSQSGPFSVVCPSLEVVSS